VEGVRLTWLRTFLGAGRLTADLLLFRSPFQPYGAWICLVLTSIGASHPLTALTLRLLLTMLPSLSSLAVILFKGFDAFIPTFKPISFVTYVPPESFFLQAVMRLLC
jgi:hypothetical protein